jgi:hypothetical protein
MALEVDVQGTVRVEEQMVAVAEGEAVDRVGDLEAGAVVDGECGRP